MSLCKKSVFLAAFGVLAAIATAAPKSYEGYKLAAVIVRSQAELEAVENLGLVILNCHYGIGSLEVVGTPEQIEALGVLGIEKHVKFENVGDLLVTERRAVGGADPFDDFFMDYHPYDGFGGILWYMNELVARYPSLASMVEIGTTLEGRTIWGLRITNDVIANKPGVLYFGCEHAREWITSTIPNYIAMHLLENYGLDPLVTDLVDNVEFFLVPVFNIDGYLYTWTTNRLWRKNRRDGYGVDINRNWGEGWGGPGSSGITSNEIYRGESPFSEPETQAMRDFIIAHPNLRAQLDVHSFAQLLLWPYGYTPALSPDEEYYRRLGTEMQTMIEAVEGTHYHIGPVYHAIYPASGGSVDWTYAQRDLLSMSFECRDKGQFGFILPPDQIIPNNEELLGSILHMTDSDWVRLPLRLEFPQGLPRALTMGQDNTIQLQVVEQTDTLEPSSPMVHYRYDSSASFESVSLTSLGGGLYQATLPPTNCSAQPEFYFTAESSTGTLVSSPRNAAGGKTHTAAMSTGRTSFFSHDLSSNPGWTTQGGWAYGIPTGAGGNTGPNDPTAGHTGSNVYGYNLSGGYPDNLPPTRLTTPAFDCSETSVTRLEFWRWLGVETPAWDHASIEASNDGVNWTKVWQNIDEVADKQWTFQSVDLSAIADGQASVSVRWTMGPTDSAFNYCGWNIDDVALTTNVCDGLMGDWEGNGTVDAADFTEFENCFTGEGGGVPANCRVFDGISDGDVDCSDWAVFHAAWTAAGEPPPFAPCADRAAPASIGAGARYLSITPTSSAPPVAIRVTSPDYPCLLKYADFAPDPVHAAAGLARLYDTPVSRAPAEWGTLRVADADLVPNRLYAVQLVTATEPWSMQAKARLLRWGDVADAIGTLNAIDISGVVDCVKLLPGAPPLQRCDLEPEVPNFLPNALDIAAAIDAVKGIPYRFGIPCD